MIKQQTATDIALIYREIKASEDLLAEIEQAQATFSQKDIRDVFGRVQGNIEVGVPNGDSSKRIFRMQWKLAKPVIEAHIADCEAQLTALNEKALIESKG